MTIKIYFDGGADPWKKTAYGSYEIVGDFCNHRVERMAHPGSNTCNTAEYLTMIAALRWLSRNHASPNTCSLEIYSDSKLLVEQMSGRWKVKVLHIKELVLQAHSLLGPFGSRKFIWRPRQTNVERFGH